MKRVMLSLIVAVFVLASLSGVLAESCNLGVSMINQDPYPAIPGDYVKLVFQVDGIDNPECGDVDVKLLEQYPLIFDPDEDGIYKINSGIYDKDFNSYFLATYKVRVDENALDGDNPLEIRYNSGVMTVDFEEQFDLNVEDIRADFEVHVKNYDPITKIITFEILNIAEADVEALTVEIPKQGSIEVKGSKVNIVGDLDSNEYTTADFEATPNAGEIEIRLTYSDTINNRRIVEKTVVYEPEYFEGRIGDAQKKGFSSYLIWIVIVGVIGYYFFRRWKKKKALQKKLNDRK